MATRYQGQAHRTATDGRPGQIGQAIVEFALILPLILLLLFGIVNISLAVGAYNGLNYAAGKGIDLAEYMTITSTLTLTQTNEITTTVYSALPPYVDHNQTAVAVAYDPVSSLVSISVTYQYPLMAGGIFGTHAYTENASKIGPIIVPPSSSATSGPSTSATPLPWHPEVSPVNANLTGVTCPSTTTCEIVGGSGSILNTTSSGAIWSQQTGPNSHVLQAIACPTTSICFAVGTKSGGAFTIDGTTDGGTTWVALSVTSSLQTFYGIACTNTQACFAVGTGGTILATTDGGNTWTSQTSHTAAKLNDITCVAGTTTCYAVGNSGTIVNTNDGSSWTAQTSGVSVALNDVACTSTTKCYVVGASGTILSTTDGSTWSPATSPTSLALNNIDCPAANTCDAVGNSGVIISTTDGSTWSTVITATQTLQAIDCASTAFCVAAGNNGNDAIMAYGP